MITTFILHYEMLIFVQTLNFLGKNYENSEEHSRLLHIASRILTFSILKLNKIKTYVLYIPCTGSKFRYIGVSINNSIKSLASINNLIALINILQLNGMKCMIVEKNKLFKFELSK